MPETPRDDVFEIGQTVWCVLGRAYGGAPRIARAVVIDIDEHVSQLYKIRFFDEATEGGYFSVHASIWRWLFPTRESAEYQLSLLPYALGRKRSGQWWVYALDAAVRAMRKKGAV